MLNVDPIPFSESTFIVQPWVEMMFFTTESPIPIPFSKREFVLLKNKSKIFFKDMRQVLRNKTHG